MPHCSKAHLKQAQDNAGTKRKNLPQSNVAPRRCRPGQPTKVLAPKATARAQPSQKCDSTYTQEESTHHEFSGEIEVLPGMAHPGIDCSPPRTPPRRSRPSTFVAFAGLNLPDFACLNTLRVIGLYLGQSAQLMLRMFGSAVCEWAQVSEIFGFRRFLVALTG